MKNTGGGNVSKGGMKNTGGGGGGNVSKGGMKDTGGRGSGRDGGMFSPRNTRTATRCRNSVI